MTTAYSDDHPLGKICKGWHKIYVKIETGFLELDSSSTKFTKIRQIEIKTGEHRIRYLDDMCYVPPPHNMIVAVNNRDSGGMWINATSLDETNKTMWRLWDKEVDGKIIKPQNIVYCTRHDALLVVDAYNEAIWILNPSTGEVFQNIEVPQLVNHFTMNVFLRASKLVIASENEIYNFSIA